MSIFYTFPSWILRIWVLDASIASIWPLFDVQAIELQKFCFLSNLYKKREKLWEKKGRGRETNREREAERKKRKKERGRDRERQIDRQWRSRGKRGKKSGSKRDSFILRDNLKNFYLRPTSWRVLVLKHVTQTVISLMALGLGKI